MCTINHHEQGDFHSAHPTRWAESVSGNGVCMYVCMCVITRKDDQDCLQASQTPITIYILKAYDERYSKIIRDHKYKYKDNDKDSDKDSDTEKVPKTPILCYTFEILMTHSFQI